MLDQTTAVEPPPTTSHRAFRFWPAQPAEFASRAVLVLTMAVIWAGWTAIAVQQLFG